MLEQVRTGDLGDMKRASLEVFFARAQALLVSDDGPGPELDRLLAGAFESPRGHPAGPREALEVWVRHRAQSRR